MNSAPNLAQDLLGQSATLNSIITQLKRHGALNSENIPLVVQVLRRESKTLTRLAFAQLNSLGERMNELQPKVDSGRFLYAQKQELDQLVATYLSLESQLEALLK